MCLISRYKLPFGKKNRTPGTEQISTALHSVSHRKVRIPYSLADLLGQAVVLDFESRYGVAGFVSLHTLIKDLHVLVVAFRIFADHLAVGFFLFVGAA